MSKFAAPLTFVVVRPDKVSVGPVALGRAFLERWMGDLRQNAHVRLSDKHLVLQVSSKVPLDIAALRLFVHVWELNTLLPKIHAHDVTTAAPLPLETNLAPRTLVLAWQLASAMRLEAPYRLLLGMALERLMPQSIWDYLGACGEFNRPGNPRHSYEWRLRQGARPMVVAFVPWLYFCLRPQAPEEYRIVMELIARSEPGLIKETLPPLLDGLQSKLHSNTARIHQARATFVGCDSCASNYDPHTDTRCFAVPDIRLAGVQDPIRCQLTVQPTGARMHCHQAPPGVQYGLELSSYGTHNVYSSTDRRPRHVLPCNEPHSDKIPAYAQSRFIGTCYQCGGRDRPVYIVQLFLCVRQELATSSDSVWRSCQSEAVRALLAPNRSHSPASPAIGGPSPTTPIG